MKIIFFQMDILSTYTIKILSMDRTRGIGYKTHNQSHLKFAFVGMLYDAPLFHYPRLRVGGLKIFRWGEYSE